MPISLLSAISVLLTCCVVCVAAGQGQGPSQPAPPAQPVPPAQRAPRDDSAAESLGWKLGLQAWTFRDRTAYEAIDAAARLGLKYIELYPGQPLSPDERTSEVGPALSSAQILALRARLAGAGITPVSYGVVGMKNDEREARAHFEFVRAMGMTTFVAEPMLDARDLASRLADEYGLAVAIHNHPKPSIYWNPDTVLESLKGRSPRLGVCADTGHWPRSGLRALDALKMLEGRILELHFKDIAKGLDAVWGTGDTEARAMLGELKRQNFRGTVYVEYETGSGPELEATVARCIAFFDQTARALAETARPTDPQE